MLATHRSVGSSILLLVGTAMPLQAATWNAAIDLKTNELSASELANPNGAVPQWSYGYRSTPVSSAITLFSAPAEHSNTILSNPNFQGWVTPTGALSIIPFVFVDVSQPVPTALSLHPDGGGGARAVEVVRWTAPFNATFTISASWQDADPRIGTGGADGVLAYFLRNGTALGGFSNANPNDGTVIEGGAVTLSSVLTLAAGETLDFALAANGSNFADSTSFNAVITGVPEPTAMALAGSALCLLGRRTRRG